MARQLRFFTSEVEKAGILVAPRLSAEQAGASQREPLAYIRSCPPVRLYCLLCRTRPCLRCTGSLRQP